MDNAPAHKGKVAIKWVSKHFRTLYIPPQSPELNPIETIFAIMKNQIYKEKPKNLKNLNFLLKNCWRTLDKVHIYRTIKHLNKICKMIINKHGSNTFK
jgi:transposase